MQEKTYNKLVRDNIPDIIRRDGKEPISYTATGEEFKQKLCEKLLEELDEFKENPTEEELADLLEVVQSLCYAFDLDITRAYKIQTAKRDERGGFTEKIILEKVIEN